MAQDVRDPMLRRAVIVVLLVLAAVTMLLVLWMALHAFLLIFAGLLFGVFLDACVRGIQRVVPLPRIWLLGGVCLVWIVLVALLILWGGMSIAHEFDNLRRLLDEQLDHLRERADALGLRLNEDGSGGGGVAELLTTHVGDILRPATTAVSTAAAALVNAVIIAIVGIFVAANPGFYRDGLVRFLPPDRRTRARRTLDEMGVILRWWLIGQLAAMVLIGVSVAIALWALGVPGGLLLALQAALLSFVPYLGALLAGVPIALAALPMGLFWLGIVLLTYTVIQVVEGYLITPLILRQAVDLPPLLTLAAMLVMGSIAGVAGVILATPLVAVGRIAVQRHYFEEWLERDAPGSAPA